MNALCLLLLAASSRAAEPAVKPAPKALDQLRGIVAALEKPPAIDSRELLPARQGTPAPRRSPLRPRLELTLEEIGVKTGDAKVGIAPKDGGPRVSLTIPF